MDRIPKFFIPLMCNPAWTPCFLRLRCSPAGYTPPSFYLFCDQSFRGCGHESIGAVGAPIWSRPCWRRTRRSKGPPYTDQRLIGWKAHDGSPQLYAPGLHLQGTLLISGQTWSAMPSCHSAKAADTFCWVSRAMADRSHEPYYFSTRCNAKGSQYSIIPLFQSQDIEAFLIRRQELPGIWWKGQDL